MTEEKSTTPPTPPASYPMVQYDLSEARVAELREKYEGLTIQGPTDKGGLALVHEGRMECKGIRVAIDKRRKQYNSGALDFTRTVNSKAKEATAPVLLLEESLKAEEVRIKAEIAEIKATKAREEEERLQSRVNLLQRFGKQVSIVNLKAMSDEEFQAAYVEAKADHEAEQERIKYEERVRHEEEMVELREREAKEEADSKAREAEDKRLASIAEEQDRIAKEQKAVADKIQADQDALAAERQAIDNDKKFEAGKKEAAEAAAQEEREKIQREAKEKEEADLLAKEKAAWEEKWKPDKEKLLAYSKALLAVPAPHVVSEEAKGIMEFTDSELSKLAGNISKYVENI